MGSVGSVSPEDLSVSSLPVGTAGGSCLGGEVALSLHTSGLLAGGGKSSLLAVVVLAADNPVDLGVAADGVVLGVHKDDFVELVGSILTNPVGAKDAEVGALAANSHLSECLVGLGLLELADTVVPGLTEDFAFADISLTATASNTDAVDDVALGSLVTKSAGLVESGRTSAPVDHGQLSVLPTSDSEHESDQVGLLLLPKFFKILVGSHLRIKILIIT